MARNPRRQKILYDFSLLFLFYCLLLAAVLFFAAYLTDTGFRLYLSATLIIAIGTLPVLYAYRRKIGYRVRWVYHSFKRTQNTATDKISSYWSSLDWYSGGKGLFWIGTLQPIITLIVYLGIQNPELTSTLLVAREQPFFSDSLLLMVNLIGFVFIVTIFLIQTTTQTYSPRLSKEVFRDQYLISIFVFLLIITIYNLSGLYFKLPEQYQLLSYSLAISSFLYLLSLSFITSYYLDISNIIGKAEKRIISKITPESIFKTAYPPLKSDEFLDEITNDTLLITNTGIVAVENNDHALVVSCIQSLENIGVEYITLLKSPVDDDFVRELNDQFEFLIQSATQDYTSQKYLEPLSRSLGELSRSTYVTTQNSTQTAMWLRSLKNVFEQTYPEMDRTESLGMSIKEINRTAILALESDAHNAHIDYGVYAGYLEDIARQSLQSGASFPLRFCLSQYQWHFISMVNSLIAERKYFEVYQIKEPLEKMADFYTTAMASKYFDTSLIEAVFFRLNSFVALFRYYGIYSYTPNQAAAVGSITASPPEELNLEPRSRLEFQYARQEQSFIECCNELLGFVDKLAKKHSGTNYHDVYSAYPQLLFIYSIDVQTQFVNKEELVIQTASGFFNAIFREVTSSTRGNPSLDIKEQVADFLLISLYCYQNNDDILSDIFEEVVNFYDKSRKQAGQKNVRWMYQYLKLTGVILAQHDDLNDTKEIVEKVLIEDYYEPPAYSGRAIQPEVTRLGFPTGMGYNIQKLSPNQVWGRGFQNAVEQEFYSNIGQQCSDYHEYLKSEHY